MKLYVISTKYQPLVTFKHGLSKKPIHKINVSNQDLIATFNASKADSLIALTDKERALEVATLLLKGHNCKPDFIEEGVRLFATPVIYTVEVDAASLATEQTLTTDDLVYYADTSTIPLYDNRAQRVRHIPQEAAFEQKMEKLHIEERMSILPKAPEIRKLTGLQSEQVVEATYISAEGTNISRNLQSNYSLNMQILSGFIAALGVAAVAAAFVALNAAALSIPGVVVAAIGLTAATLGTVGLFKYAPQTSAANNDHEVLLEMPSA
jgi:hypothetical protein